MMFFSNILNYFNHISKSIGLPPIILICVIAVFIFIFIFGLVILKKVRRIRNNLIVLNRGLRTLNRNIKTEMASLKAEIVKIKKGNDRLKSSKQAANGPVNESSNRSLPESRTGDQNTDRAQKVAGPDLRKIELPDDRGEISDDDIKDKVLQLLETTGKPISYSEIVKYLSKNSSTPDFELMLKYLEQLKREGVIIGQVSAGKLYFQKK